MRFAFCHIAFVGLTSFSWKRKNRKPHFTLLFSSELLINWLTTFILSLNGQFKIQKRCGAKWQNKSLYSLCSSPQHPPEYCIFTTICTQKSVASKNKTIKWAQYPVLTSYHWKRHSGGQEKLVWITDATPPPSPSNCHAVQKRSVHFGDGEHSDWEILYWTQCYTVSGENKSSLGSASTLVQREHLDQP